MEWNNVDVSLILFGAAFISFGVYMCLGYFRAKKSCTSHAIGTVIDLKENRIVEKDKYGIKSYKISDIPIIQYEANGRIYHKEYQCTNSKKYTRGETVDLYYNPKRPESFIIGLDTSILMFNIGFTVAGVAAIIIGIFLPEIFS